MIHKYAPHKQVSLFFCFFFMVALGVFAQVGIGNTNPNANALLEIGDATTTTQGLLLPRVDLVSTTSFAPMAAHLQGMVVYNKNTAGDVTPGYYYNDGSQWVRIAAASVPSNDWTILGNSGLNANNNFLGTTDDVALRFRTNNADRFEISTGNAASRGRLRAFENGDAAAPIYSWNANVRTGMFQQAANVIGFSTNGTERFRIPNANQVHANSNGTAALPFYSWASDPDIGIYRSAANTLAISTTATERMRFLANGQVVINNTAAPIAGDRLTVQGANNEFTINGYASGATGVGVYGENATTNAIGIFGNVAVGFGVYGQSTGGGIGVDGYNPAAGLGVRGFNDGTGIGVAGYNTSSGIAVYGWNQGTGNGVRGDASNSENGVYGQNTGTGSGVYGISNNASGYGLRGFHLSTTGTGILATGNNAASTYLTSGTGIASNGENGIFGYGRVATGTGVIGTGNNSTSIITNINGGGVAGSGTRNGVFGYAGLGAVANGNRGNAGGIFMLDTDNNVSNNGANNNNGIRASAVIAGFDNIAFNDNATPTPTSYPAQDSYFGGYFSGGTERTGGAATTPSYAYVGLRYNTATDGLSGTDFKIVGPGNVSTIISDEKNVPRIMFAPEAPEIVFQDYGVGQLVNGQVYIALDPVLKNSLHIDNEHPLKVFVTLEGDCNGVYVTNKSADGFTVKELQNGTSNVSFSWQIVANRADTEDANGRVVSKHVGLRLPEGPGPLNLTAKNNESITDTRKIEIKTPVKSQLQEVVKTSIKSNGANAASADMINNELQTQPTSTPSEVPVENLNTPAPSDILNTKEK